MAGLGPRGSGLTAYDPLGNYISFQNVPTPPVQPSYYGPPAGGMGSLFGFNGSSTHVTCVWDNLPVDCNKALHALRNGIVWNCGPAGCGPRNNNGELVPLNPATGGWERDAPREPKERIRRDHDAMGIDRGPQDTAPTIPLGDLFQNIADILANDKCSKFISALINKAAELTDKKPYSTSAAQLVNKVAGQPYGGYKFEDNKVGGGSAFGAIARGEATANFGSKALTVGTLTPELIRATQLDYALRAIHETIHLAGGAASAYNGYGAYYTDEVLAEAARRLTGAPGFPTDVKPDDPYKVYKYGGYWDQQLRDHCLPSSK